MKLSDSLLVSRASGNSRKYCLTMSATSYAWWFSNFKLSGSSSANCFRRWIRDFTPGLRNNPTWSRALSSSHRKADWMNGGRAEPFFWTLVINGTPNTVLSATERKSKSKWYRCHNIQYYIGYLSTRRKIQRTRGDIFRRNVWKKHRFHIVRIVAKSVTL